MDKKFFKDFFRNSKTLFVWAAITLVVFNAFRLVVYGNPDWVLNIAIVGFLFFVLTMSYIFRNSK